MSAASLSLEQVRQLAFDTLSHNGCNEENAAAVADTITMAERDICRAHGLFRLPGYVASLRSGKVNGSASPTVENPAPAVLRVDGDDGYAPLALKTARDPLAQCARENGIAAMSLVRIHHFAALWIEIESLTAQGLAAMAFTAYMPSVAPAGGIKPFYGTNPMAFGWPRPGRAPMVWDQASAALARGEVMIAAREGRTLPAGAGLDKQGNPSRDPSEILEGSLLPFGGYKGASIALMIELLAGPLTGERCSFEAAAADNGDGGPPRGGELLIAMDPLKFGNKDNPFAHADRLFTALLEQAGTRLPGERRIRNRKTTMKEGVTVPGSLMDKITGLINQPD